MNNKFLSHMGSKFGIENFIYTGFDPSSVSDSLRASMISDVMEAILGAVYIDLGISSARLVVSQYLTTYDSQFSAHFCLSEVLLATSFMTHCS